jgi:hypothetical protein
MVSVLASLTDPSPHSEVLQSLKRTSTWKIAIDLAGIVPTCSKRRYVSSLFTK